MNRRNFLKRIAAVAVGAVAVPIVLADGTKYTMGVDLAKGGSNTCCYRYYWEDYSGYFRPVRKRKDPPFLHRETSKPEYKIDTYYTIPNGIRTYRYIYGRVQRHEYYYR